MYWKTAKNESGLIYHCSQRFQLHNPIHFITFKAIRISSLLKNKALNLIRSKFLLLLLCGILQCISACAKDIFTKETPEDSIIINLDRAKAYFATLAVPDSSPFWPNVSPRYFMENLELYLKNPLYAFDNKNTNFCGYTAISFVTIARDPEGFIKFMIQLYKDGKAKMGKVEFEPNKRVRMIAGKLKYKGLLDLNPATQMWLLTLADHFKGYLNIFNKRYHEGDENTIWASTNYAKFNRMLRRLFDWKVVGRGADLVKPDIKDLYTYLIEQKQKGIVFLYLNNRLLYRKTHVVAKFGIPTHYVLLQSITKYDDKINIVYLDGGRKTQQQLSPEFFRKIVYGVTTCSVKVDD